MHIKLLKIKDESVILAFGDSLTNGFGVGYECSYPQYFEKKTELEIINAGVDGEFSHAGLSRLPELLLYKPDLVILCHGANDILCKLSIQMLKSNMLAMIKLIKDSGAKVLLIGVPDYYDYAHEVHKIYIDTAEEMDILLENKVLKKITLDDFLRNDAVHPNDIGYEKMADTFIELLSSNKYFG